MATRETIRHVGEILGVGHDHPRWSYENGFPGWTRAGSGYPCIQWADMHFPGAYDRRQELDLLNRELEEMERSLREIRERIKELEEKPVNPS